MAEKSFKEQYGGNPDALDELQERDERMGTGESAKADLTETSNDDVKEERVDEELYFVGNETPTIPEDVKRETSERIANEELQKMKTIMSKVAKGEPVTEEETLESTPIPDDAFVDSDVEEKST